MVDMGRVPQRLVERVGKAQRHEVLHRFLAEIMIDAIDLLFAEDLADRGVEFGGRGEVAADGLFDDDAGVLGDQLVIADPFGNVAEDGRRHRQIEGRTRSLPSSSSSLRLSQPCSLLASTEM